jgi:hypothetical protein
MTTSKIQLRGHCQRCGRLQAGLAYGSLMAKHGYTVKDRGQYGYFSGTCSGSGFQPIELSRSLADACVAEARNDAIAHADNAAALKAGRATPLQVQGNWDFVKREYAMIPFAEAPEYKQREAVRSAIFREEQRSRMAAEWAAAHEALIARVHGQPMVAVTKPAGPAPILIGEQRRGRNGNGVWTVTGVHRGMVRFANAEGKTGKVSMRAWRLLPLITPEV